MIQRWHSLYHIYKQNIYERNFALDGVLDLCQIIDIRLGK